jgi:hypothetical protein
LEIQIDLNVTFKLGKARKAVVDAEELAEFVKATWGAGELKVDPEDGKEKRFIDVNDALQKLNAWIVERNKDLVLSQGETLAIWKVATSTAKDKDGAAIDNSPWAQKKRSWDEPSGTNPGSAASTPATNLDSRYMPDPDDAPTPSA